MTREKRSKSNKTEQSNLSDDEHEITHKDLAVLITDLKKTVEYLSSQLDELQNENKILKQNLKICTKNNEELKERIQVLENNIETTEREKISKNIIITGIKKQGKDEDTADVVNRVINGLSIKIEKEDIVKVSRKENYKENSPIIVQLKSKEVKETIIDARKKIGSITTTECKLKGENRDIYINEQLTYMTNNLFYKARELKKQHKYKYLWTRDNKIFIRKTETSNKIKISNITDLEKIN